MFQFGSGWFDVTISVHQHRSIFTHIVDSHTEGDRHPPQIFNALAKFSRAPKTKDTTDPIKVYHTLSVGVDCITCQVPQVHEFMLMPKT